MRKSGAFCLRAQSFTEYALLFGLVTMALVGMQVYMKRGIQAVVKVASDELGTQENPEVLINFNRQQETNSKTQASTTGSITRLESPGGIHTRNINTTTESITSSTSTQRELAAEQEIK
jgi:hypothetical protein